jgi:hypothetical protein
MNVHTDLKAGGVLQNVAAQAEVAASQTAGFLSKANSQAQDFTSSLVNKTTALWNCASNAFRS